VFEFWFHWVDIEKTPLPKVNSTITVDGGWFSHNRMSETISLALKDFSFLPRSLSTSKSAEMADYGMPPNIPQKKIWITPRAQPK